jgi:hypothetical protein
MTANPITLAKSSQGYLIAMQRPRCGNCDHLIKADNPQLVDQCGQGRFMVSKWSICRLHEFKRPYQAATATPG